MNRCSRRLRAGLVDRRTGPPAQQYAHEHGSDIRQSILELNLISPELLNQLAFERLGGPAYPRPVTEKVAGRSSPASLCPDLPLSPDRTQHHRDVRKELAEAGADGPVARVGRPDPGTGVRLPRHRHPL